MARPGMNNFLTTDIYGITTEEFCRGRGNVETARQLLAAGVRVIQYREKAKPGRRMFEECLAIRELCCEARATFIVNDHVDLALLVGADGVHVGQDDLPPREVRRLIGPDMVLGLSTHAPEQAHEAAALGVVDYIGIGPIFTTATKKDAATPVGLDMIEYAAHALNLPFVPIGGIKEENVAEVFRRGAKIVCIISDIIGAEDIPAKVRALRAAVTR